MFQMQNDTQKKGNETFLVADVYFPNCYNKNSNLLVSDIQKYDTFRGKYKNANYYMVKSSAQIERIHYIGGVRP